MECEAYFRLGQAHRGLKQWEAHSEGEPGARIVLRSSAQEAIDAFREGRFREPSNQAIGAA